MKNQTEPQFVGTNFQIEKFNQSKKLYHFVMKNKFGLKSKIALQTGFRCITLHDT